MALLRPRNTSKPRQPLFGHGSLINPGAEHTILDPFQPPISTASQIYENLAHTALATEAVVAVNPLEPVVIQPDSYRPEMTPPASID